MNMNLIAQKRFVGVFRRNAMPSAKTSRGFTLIASLLLMLLLSGFALSLLMMVNTEQRSGGYDLNNNYTYHAAEGAMEQATSNLANTFKSIQAPSAAQICNLSTNPGPPTWDSTVTYPLYNIAPVPIGAQPACTSLTTVWGQIQSGPDAGLYAQIIPVAINIQAQRGTGEFVSMTRTSEVALIPVFQFGVFSDSDLFYGQSPNLGFAGRVHTNGDLYLGVANGANLVFGDKLSAFGNVIRQQMDDGLAVGGGLDDGTVLIPTQSNGCNPDLAALQAGTAINPSGTCIDISTTALGGTNGSVVGGHGSAQNTASWINVSQGTYNSYLIDGNSAPPSTTDGPNNTGASDLTLPFVQGTTSALEIIRRPPVGETPTSLLGGSRLANQAQIRILLSDKEADLHLIAQGWNGNTTQDVELASMVPASVFVNDPGPFASSGGAQSGIIINGNTYYFGESACGGGSVGNPCTSGDPNFIWPQFVPGGALAAQNVTKSEWPLINGWLLVEVLNANTGLWVGVTREWLQLGFARGVQAPTGPGSGPNAVAAQATNSIGAAGSNYLTDHKNAILYFQMTADRNGDGTITNNLLTANPKGDEVTFNSLYTGGSVTPVPTTYSGANSQYNWYPINLYDSREGENNDAANPGSFNQTTGTPNGVMNSVELDVGNLRNWLLGLTGSTGSTVNYSSQNGYVVYFSDRRGEQYNPLVSLTQLIGEYGFEDTVNLANAGSKFAPDGKLDPVNYNGAFPEDVNGNSLLDNYGVKTVGDAFGQNTANDTDSINPPSPYAQRLGTAERINTFTIGRANRVTGARHALKLVDGSLGNLPTMPPGNPFNSCAQSAANPTACGGFTVASENPVYILGNYNTNCPTAVGGGTFNPCTPGNATFDATWTNPANAEPNHSAASIIADAVSLLSNNWQDAGISLTYLASGSQTNGSLENPINPDATPGDTPNRLASTTYYRVAIAGGKTIAFNNPANNPDSYFGSDGGVHNFLRFVEDWYTLGGASQKSLYYKGSLVSLYWNTYATGSYKCCNLVYHPPNRQYTFDPLFSSPQNLPPGTPMFRNVDNLSYRQNQIARTN
jgi:Tfp pilus assembly protein PilX